MTSRVTTSPYLPPSPTAVATNVHHLSSAACSRRHLEDAATKLFFSFFPTLFPVVCFPQYTVKEIKLGKTLALSARNPRVEVTSIMVVSQS